MEKENTTGRLASIRSVILESKKIREERGEDFYINKKVITEQSQIDSKIPVGLPENNYKNIRDTHLKLNNFISEYDKKNLDNISPVLKVKKPRSKSIHLYIDENIEHFLTTESKKAQTNWGLRKNAGLGQLIQKFIFNFIELKKREEKQLKRVRKSIEDFRNNLVEFKKYSTNAENYAIAEQYNQKMKVLSNDLRILLTLLEFEDAELKICLGEDQHGWIEFIIQWKYHS